MLQLLAAFARKERGMNMRKMETEIGIRGQEGDLRGLLDLRANRG
jgi:hypothetical protein